MEQVSCLNLFRRILDEQQSLPNGDASRDLLHLINFVLRKFFKRVADDPFVIVRALGPKSRGHWKELSSYKSDEESDDGMGGQRSRIKENVGHFAISEAILTPEQMAKGPIELAFKKSKKLTWSQQMGIVVAMLVREGHEDWISWVIEVSCYEYIEAPD